MVAFRLSETHIKDELFVVGTAINNEAELNFKKLQNRQKKKAKRKPIEGY